MGKIASRTSASNKYSGISVRRVAWCGWIYLGAVCFLLRQPFTTYSATSYTSMVPFFVSRLQMIIAPGHLMTLEGLRKCLTVPAPRFANLGGVTECFVVVPGCRPPNFALRPLRFASVSYGPDVVDQNAKRNSLHGSRILDSYNVRPHVSFMRQIARRGILSRCIACSYSASLSTKKFLFHLAKLSEVPYLVLGISMWRNERLALIVSTA